MTRLERWSLGAILIASACGACAYAPFAGWLALGAYVVPKMDDKPLGAWDETHTFAYVTVVNQTVDSVPVEAIGPRVDHVIRLLGHVPAHDSATYRIPYLDTDVILLVDSWWFLVDTRVAGTHRFTVRPTPRGPEG